MAELVYFIALYTAILYWLIIQKIGWKHHNMKQANLMKTNSFVFCPLLDIMTHNWYILEICNQQPTQRAVNNTYKHVTEIILKYCSPTTLKVNIYQPGFKNSEPQLEEMQM